MSRELSEDGIRLAVWDGNGNLCLQFGVYTSGQAAKLAAFIQAGPPRKVYRITRTFETKPCGVLLEQPNAAGRGQGVILYVGDVEEVWEDEEAPRG